MSSSWRGISSLATSQCWELALQLSLSPAARRARGARSAALSALARAGRREEVLEVLREMRRGEVEVDRVAEGRFIFLGISQRNGDLHET